MKTMKLVIGIFLVLTAANAGWYDDVPCEETINNIELCINDGYEPRMMEGCTIGKRAGYRDGTKACPFNERRSMRKCDYHCPIHGGWTDETWSDCSKECGGGTQSRSRTCTSPTPKYDGADCAGDADQTRKCNLDICPDIIDDDDDDKEVDCEETINNIELCINDGYEPKVMEGCTIGKPAGYRDGTRACPFMEKRSIRRCNYHCPIHGGWTDETWSDCSKECGGGTQSRSRTCTSPTPKYDGADCTGDADQTRKCNEDLCPVDGGWSDFSDWSKCSVECDGGTQTRSRTCTNPAPAYDGAGCEGAADESQDCNVDPCSDWIPVKRNRDISWDLASTSLQVKVRSKPGSNDMFFMRTFFGKKATGAFFLRFSSPPQYRLRMCNDEEFQPLLADLPADYEKIFTITRGGSLSGGRVKIECNGVVIVDLVPSHATCAWKEWDGYWNKDSNKISFRDGVSFEYRALPRA